MIGSKLVYPFELNRMKIDLTGNICFFMTKKLKAVFLILRHRIYYVNGRKSARDA